MDSVVGRLARLRAPVILIYAAAEGLIGAVECTMPICVCPQGRTHFEPTGSRSKPWMPTPDRWPVPGRDGGNYVTSNVRLAHARCNYVEGGRVGSGLAVESGWYGSEKQRETSLRGIRTLHKTWGKSAAASAVRRRPGVDLPLRRWERSPEARGAQLRAGQRLAEWNSSPAARVMYRVRDCKRWNIGRGQACVCGDHGTAPIVVG